MTQAAAHRILGVLLAATTAGATSSACKGEKSEAEMQRIRDENYARHYGDENDPTTLAGRAKLEREAKAQKDAETKEATAVAALDLEAASLNKTVSTRLICKSLWFVCNGTHSNTAEELRRCEQDPTEWDVTGDARNSRAKTAQKTAFWSRVGCERFVHDFETTDRQRVETAQRRLAAESKRDTDDTDTRDNDRSARMPKGSPHECETRASSYRRTCEADCKRSGASIPGCQAGTDCYQNCIATCSTLAGVELRTCNGD
ncbi:MAG: hypothetical protein KA201_09170 [Kofleriaceae bacterium]|nr:hypothetical protein [Kofleriaceae bacterium]